MSLNAPKKSELHSNNNDFIWIVAQQSDHYTLLSVNDFVFYVLELMIIYQKNKMRPTKIWKRSQKSIVVFYVVLNCCSSAYSMEDRCVNSVKHQTTNASNDLT